MRWILRLSLAAFLLANYLAHSLPVPSNLSPGLHQITSEIGRSTLPSVLEADFTQTIKRQSGNGNNDTNNSGDQTDGNTNSGGGSISSGGSSSNTTNNNSTGSCSSLTTAWKITIGTSLPINLITIAVAIYFGRKNLKLEEDKKRREEAERKLRGVEMVPRSQGGASE